VRAQPALFCFVEGLFHRLHDSRLRATSGLVIDTRVDEVIAIIQIGARQQTTSMIDQVSAIAIGCLKHLRRGATGASARSQVCQCLR